jgi:hypothetical protein
LDPPALQEKKKKKKKKKNMAPTRSCIGFACKMRAPDTEPKVSELRLTDRLSFRRDSHLGGGFLDFDETQKLN